jgi:hypothetical protein
MRYVIVLLVFFLTACTTTVRWSGEQLLLTQKTVVSIATAADALCTQGKLTQAQCDEASHLYTQARSAYALALAAERIAINAAIAQVEAQDTTEALSAWTAIASDMVVFAARVGIIKE